MNKFSSESKGIAIISVLYLSFFIVAFVVLLSSLALQNSRGLAQLIKYHQQSFIADGGVQLGLAHLNKKLSYVEKTINTGVLADGTTKHITESDLLDYDTNGHAGKFWIDFINGLAGEPDFTSTDGFNTAQFSISDASHDVNVRLFFANPQTGPTKTTSGYNDVTLRYGYEIESTPKDASCYKGKTLKIRSYADNYSDADRAIQIHIGRSLSNYNMFTEWNTLPDKTTPIYDSVSYTGDVYSAHTIYVSGGPKYDGKIEIANTEATPVYHKASGTSYTFQKSNGSTNVPEIVTPKNFPGSTDETVQKAIAYWGDAGYALPPVTFGEIHLGTSTITLANGSVEVSTVSVYSLGNTSVTIVNMLPEQTTTLYRILNYDSGQQVDVYQYVWKLKDPYFLIYADGNMKVQGRVTGGSKTTIAASYNLTIMDDIEYGTNGNKPLGYDPLTDTVIGLISWNSDILITKDLPGTGNNITLDAVIMAPKGGFGAEGWSNIDSVYTEYKGNVMHTGAFIRYYALPTLSHDGRKGWGLFTQYDSALASMKSPPFFPGNGDYKLKDSGKVRVVDSFKRVR